MKSRRESKTISSRSDSDENVKGVSRDKKFNSKKNTKETIIHYISEYPGTYFSKIKRALGLSTGAMTYHTRKLEREGIIKFQKKGGRKFFYLQNAKIGEGRSTERQNEVIETIGTYPGISTIELATFFETTRQAMSYHVNNLSDMGFIKSRKEKRKFLWFASKK